MINSSGQMEIGRSWALGCRLSGCENCVHVVWVCVCLCVGSSGPRKEGPHLSLFCNHPFVLQPFLGS